jgi:hypothetical protein
MRITLTTDRATQTMFARAGDTVDLPTDEARRMIAAGQAELAGTADRESAASAPTHQAAQTSPPGNRKSKIPHRK